MLMTDFVNKILAIYMETDEYLRGLLLGKDFYVIRLSEFDGLTGFFGIEYIDSVVISFSHKLHTLSLLVYGSNLLLQNYSFEDTYIRLNSLGHVHFSNKLVITRLENIDDQELEFEKLFNGNVDLVTNLDKVEILNYSNASYLLRLGDIKRSNEIIKKLGILQKYISFSREDNFKFTIYITGINSCDYNYIGIIYDILMKRVVAENIQLVLLYKELTNLMALPDNLWSGLCRHKKDSNKHITLCINNKDLKYMRNVIKDYNYKRLYDKVHKFFDDVILE